MEQLRKIVQMFFGDSPFSAALILYEDFILRTFFPSVCRRRKKISF